MSGGGGGGQNTVSQVTIPKELLPSILNAIKQAEKVAALPYVGYGGQRIAGFDPSQIASMTKMMGLNLPGQFGEATDATRDAMGLGMDTANTGLSRALSYAPGSWNAATAKAYGDPYQQGVTDLELAGAQRQHQITSLNDNLNAGAHEGALGGARNALLQAERERALGTQLDTIQAKGSEAGWQNAQSQFERDRAAAAQSAGLAGNLGTSGLATGMTGAGQMGQLGTAQQAAQMDLLKNQMAVGDKVQAQNQQILSQKYADFLEQRGYPKEMAAFLASMTRGTDLAHAGTTTTQTPQPSMLGQLGGLAAAAAGAYGANGGFKS